MDIAAWLKELGLERYQDAFRDNAIDPAILPKLTADDVRDIGVTAVGHRRKLLDAIAALTPSEKIAPAPVAKPEAERRQLTVLFCDLVGSTALSARLDPEDMGQVIRAYQGCCTEGVVRWGGHVAKYMGDGVLAYFGWPQAHEDEAERAVRAGLELVESVAKLDTPAGEDLAARIGIATGLVMVGELVGEGASQEQAVIGDTPNLAARLQALAQPGSVVIAASTRRLLGGLFALSDLGPVHLKGFAEPLAAFRVEGEGGAQGRFEALRGERLTPLVGRQHELAILMERWSWTKEGEGQVVLLSGEPGIGKSRLLRALREELSGEPHVALSHFCSPHHTNSALYPIIARLERAAGFTSEGTPEAKLAQLEALLGQGSAELDEAVPLLAALLAIPDGGRAEDGLAEIEAALATWRAIGGLNNRTHFLNLLAEACRLAGRPEAGMAALDEAEDISRGVDLHAHDAETYRRRGELFLAMERTDDAAAVWLRAIDVARLQETKTLELRAANSVARLWAGQGRYTEARDLLVPVYGWFTEGFDTADLKDSKALLDELR